MAMKLQSFCIAFVGCALSVMSCFSLASNTGFNTLQSLTKCDAVVCEVSKETSLQSPEVNSRMMMSHGEWVLNYGPIYESEDSDLNAELEGLSISEALRLTDGVSCPVWQ